MTAGLSGLLGRLGLVGATGVLAVSRRRLIRRFVLEQGRLEQMVSNAREDRFIEWLLTCKGLRSDHQQKLAQLAGEQEGPLSAGVVAGAGVLAADELTTRLREWLEAMLADAAGWRDGTFAIQPGRVRLGDEPTAGWPLADAGLRLARTRPPKRTVRLPDGVVAALGPEQLSGVELETIERATLERLASPVRSDDVPALVEGADRDSVRAALERLWNAGLIVPAAPPRQDEERAAERSRGPVTEEELLAFIEAAEREDLSGLLGVAPGADPAEVRRAYYRTVRRYHPDRFQEGPLAALHRRVEQAFRLVHEAHQVLTDPRARERWEKSKQAPKTVDPRSAARATLRRAREMAAAGRRVDAVAQLEKAARAAPDDPDVQLSLAILLAGNPRRRSDAIATLRRLSGTYPSRTDVLGALALALARAGESAEAQRVAARALELDPSGDAARAVRGDSAAADRLRGDPLLGPLLG